MVVGTLYGYSSPSRERGERFAEPVEPHVEVEGAFGVEHGEHCAVAFLGGQLDQPGHIQLTERVVTRDADQRPPGVVAPRVIRAGESPSRAAVFVGQASAAVSTDVEQCPDLAVVAANDDDRTPDDVVGEVIAGLADIAPQSDEQRHAQEDLVDLVGELVGVGVDGRRHLHRGVAHVGQARLDVDPQPFEDVVEDGHVAEGIQTGVSPTTPDPVGGSFDSVRFWWCVVESVTSAR